MSAIRSPAEGSAPLPSIATGILSPQDRVPRAPLLSWATRLLRELADATTTVRGVRDLAGVFGYLGNNAGLIAALRGDTRMAWWLTERQVWWHGRQARRSRDAALAACAVQPWINLGRLEALAGKVDEALSRFSVLGTYDVSGRLEMGCVRLGGSGWQAVSRSRDEFLHFLDAVYVSDSFKTLLMNGRFERVSRFSSSVAETPRWWLREEAGIVAESRLGDHTAALSRATTAAREATGWNRAVLRLRLAEAHACAGDVERARPILSQLAGVVRQLSGEAMAKPDLMPITARLAGACHECGLADDACAVARHVLTGARTARDEMIEIEMLRLLADASPDDEVQGWRDSAQAAVDATDYARFRRGAPPRPDPVFDELYERLLAIYR